MTRDFNTLLDVLMRDLPNADADFQPTHYWQSCSRRLIEDLNENGLARFRAQRAPLTHFVPTYTLNALAGQPEQLADISSSLHAAIPDNKKMHLHLDRLIEGRDQAEADYRVYRSADKSHGPWIDRASESAIGSPVGQLEMGGRRFSRSMLNYLLGLCFAKNCIGEFRVRNVLEIGGGFGTLGEILLQDVRNDTCYIDIDIPPTSIYSTYYLSELLGTERVVDYEQLADTDEISVDKIRELGDAAVLPPWLLPKLTGPIDLFVNFISFQEMEPHVVERYLHEVTRLQPDLILLRNIAEGREIARTQDQLGVLKPTRSEDYDRFLATYEFVAADAEVFGYRTVDGFHSELRLYRRKN